MKSEIEKLDEAMRRFRLRINTERPKFIRPAAPPITSSSKPIMIEGEEVDEYFADKQKFLAKLLRDGRAR